MPTSQRVQRVGDEIQKSLALLIQRNMKDPRVGFVTVSSVTVSKDFSYADVNLSWLDLEEKGDCIAALEVIQNAAGFLRTQLAKDIRLRVMPKLRFHYDESLVSGARMSQLIDAAVSRDNSGTSHNEAENSLEDPPVNNTSADNA